jgi:CDGSH-type Zn-finger protein/uncharacterized Fe-S cluster protein YjdI
MPPYTGQDQDRRYTGENADVTYSLKRCIHAEQCIKRLPGVFDAQKRPWIQPSDTSADALVEMVVHCPSGALHVIRKDGGIPEPTPTLNRIAIKLDGPLEISGDLTLTGAMVDITGETRASLCRCGASKNKPFCDNSHKDIAFAPDRVIAPTVVLVSQVEGGTLHIEVLSDGCLHLSGQMQMVNESGEVIFAGDGAKLCRCGQSGNKPFCDGTHHKIGFKGE